MALHRVYLPGPAPLAAGEVVVAGDEARHAARVKRVEAGDAIEVLDGRGGVGAARVAAIEKARDEWRLRLEVTEVRMVEPVRPRLQVLSPAPKGPRLAELIDGLSQAGAASWGWLQTERASPEPGEHRREKLERTAAEASKQCGRAWLLEIAPPARFAGALSAGPVALADASGGPYRATGAGRLTLLVGPEGGWSPRELAAARDAGALVARFGPHVMRVETAALVATALVLDAESRAR